MLAIQQDETFGAMNARCCWYNLLQSRLCADKALRHNVPITGHPAHRRHIDQGM